MTAQAFKRSIRDLQVWCSSCMVAFAGPDPIAVLIGAKRPSATLIHKIAVHPDHRRQGHGRHLLTSLGSKLAILGPPRMVAEVPVAFSEARALFSTAGYVEEATLTDYVLADQTSSQTGADLPRSHPEDLHGRLLIPVTVDDIAANDLLTGESTTLCWSRSLETLTARKDDIAGLAVASDERLEAYVLHLADGEIASLRTFVEDGGLRLRQLLTRLRARGSEALRLPKVHPAEISSDLLDAIGFRCEQQHRQFAATARSN
jgi:hypothetical protein